MRAAASAGRRLAVVVGLLATLALLSPVVGGTASAAAAGEAAPAVTLPELDIESPPELRRYLARLDHIDRERLAGAMQLTGLRDPGPPIRVLLAAEGSPLAQRVPPWVAGYAMGEIGTVVVFPSRASVYPY
ncbi:MAG TPA: hypothetical protein VM617_00385, partial [Thermoanaerobaculia bacterium]|nr:hypothetical protein [Thermoanaerobaculia bacterium]